jgi:hypothetical protein
MEGLYKLQIGGQKHWNVYTKSFLQFGINSARRRHFKLLALQAARDAGNSNAVLAVTKRYLTENTSSTNDSDNDNDGDTKIKATTSSTEEASEVTEEKYAWKMAHLKEENPCFHEGYNEVVENIILNDSDPNDSTVTITIHGPKKQEKNGNIQLNMCLQSLRPLMEKDDSSYCSTVYHGECSIGGQYQPRLPQGKYRHFFATSSYQLPWTFLRLNSNITLSEMEIKAANICSLTLKETYDYVKLHKLNEIDEKLGVTNQYFCFMAAYTLVLLKDGYGFTSDDTITSMNKVNGFTTGWPLGAILHEINNLPWELAKEPESTMIGQYLFCTLIGIIVGGYIVSRIFWNSTSTSNGSELATPTDLEMITKNGSNSNSSNSSNSTLIDKIKQGNPFSESNKIKSLGGYRQIPDDI